MKIKIVKIVITTMFLFAITFIGYLSYRQSVNDLPDPGSRVFMLRDLTGHPIYYKVLIIDNEPIEVRVDKEGHVLPTDLLPSTKEMKCLPTM